MDPTKKESDPPESTWQDEGLEFELTDLGDARRVLDEESISQFDVAAIESPAHWKRVRRDPLPTDRALSGQTIDWLLSLPADLHPQHLSTQFPRIANALATVWADPEERQVTLEKLVNSQRKGRKGFPREVQNELAALHDWMTGLKDWDQPF